MAIEDTLQKYLPKAITGENYPVTAYIKKTRAGQDKWVKDQAARITDDNGQQKYVLDREDEETIPVAYDHIANVDDSDGGQDIVFIKSPNKGQYKPFIPDPDVEVDSEEANWENFRTVAAMNERESWKEASSWLEENKELVVFGLMGIGVMLSQIGGAYYIKTVMEGADPLADQIGNLAQAIQQAGLATGSGG